MLSLCLNCLVHCCPEVYLCLATTDTAQTQSHLRSSKVHRLLVPHFPRLQNVCDSHTLWKLFIFLWNSWSIHYIKNKSPMGWEDDSVERALLSRMWKAKFKSPEFREKLSTLWHTGGHCALMVRGRVENPRSLQDIHPGGASMTANNKMTSWQAIWVARTSTWSCSLTSTWVPGHVCPHSHIHTTCTET